MSIESAPRILVYLLRRDLRLTDNPIFHALSPSGNLPDGVPDFTHILPLYVFAAREIDLDGFLTDPGASNPYPPARSKICGFYRTGRHRAKFLGETVWELKETLQEVTSSKEGMVVRVGALEDVVKNLLQWYGENEAARGKIIGLWMTQDEVTEEKHEEMQVQQICSQFGVDFRSWLDEKYFVDDRDLPFQSLSDLPNVFTTYRKQLEPLRERPRPALPRPTSLPSLPPSLPPQILPFSIPSTKEALLSALLSPLKKNLLHPSPAKLPNHPPGAFTAHPFSGGEEEALDRLRHLLLSGAISKYKERRNGLLGEGFSTKLSAWLSLGALSARTIHWALRDLEEGRIPAVFGAEELEEVWKAALGWAGGENEGTKAVRFELLWRDYMRLCAMKFGEALWKVGGFRSVGGEGWEGYVQNNPNRKGGPSGGNEENDAELEENDDHDDREEEELARSREPPKGPSKKKPVREKQPQKPKIWASFNPATDLAPGAPLTRFLVGTTGISLIDASMRELLLTGYTSNRARQNVASFLTTLIHPAGGSNRNGKVPLDWRIGAEWYDSLLVDADPSSNWGNWQYVAGVGNDPREGRSFNPVKQALEYDPKGLFCSTWIRELRGVRVGKDGSALAPGTFESATVEVDQERLMGVYQPWRLPESEKVRLGLKGLDWVERPLVQIPFSVVRKGGFSGGGRGGAGGGRGGRGGFRGGRGGAGRGGGGGRGTGGAVHGGAHGNSSGNGSGGTIVRPTEPVVVNGAGSCPTIFQ